MGINSDIQEVLFSTLDGKEICRIGNVSPVTIECKQVDIYSENLSGHNFVSFRKQESLEVTIEEPTQTIQKFFQSHEPSKSKFAIVTKMPIPKRTHKKRRIAKKWLKRYGYKLINVLLPGIELVDCSWSENVIRFKRDSISAYKGDL